MSEIETVAAEITQPTRGRPKEHPHFEVALEPEDAFFPRYSEPEPELEPCTRMLSMTTATLTHERRLTKSARDSRVS